MNLKTKRKRCTVTVGTKVRSKKYCQTALRKGSANAQVPKLIKGKWQARKELLHQVIQQDNSSRCQSIL